MTKDFQSKIFLYFFPVYYIYNMFIDVVFVRGNIIGVIINILILIFFIYCTLCNSYNKKFVYIYAWIIFNIFLIFCNSSDIIFSLKEFAKTIIGLLCFPLSFYFISTNKQINSFFKILIYVMLLYILNLILANTFGWGNAYAGDSEYAVQGGAALVTGSMPVVIVLMMAPFILDVIPREKLFIGIWSLTIICVLLILKRTNIASMLIGYFLIFIFTRIYNYKTVIKKHILSGWKLSKYVLILFFILSVLSIMLWPVIVAQFEARSYRFEKSTLEKEGRIIEWILVKKAILHTEKIDVFLLGKEPYNTPNNYGFGTARNIHGDYSMILFSTGIIGSVLYWSMQLYIALLIFKYRKKRYLENNRDVLLFAIYLSTSAIWFLFSFSATLRYVLVSASYYMIYGMILRYFWNKHRVQEKMIALKKYKNENTDSSKL